MPFENDLPLETETSNATEPEVPLQAWERRVGQAHHRDDKNELRALFDELSSIVPVENVSREWLRVVSGWDARARTG